MKTNYERKITFWLRLAGWLCLLPASVYLYFYQALQGTQMATAFLIELVIVFLFAIFILTTAKSARWHKPSSIFMLMVFAFIFVSIIIFIPLFVAYRNCRIMNNL